MFLPERCPSRTGPSGSAAEAARHQRTQALATTKNLLTLKRTGEAIASCFLPQVGCLNPRTAELYRRLYAPTIADGLCARKRVARKRRETRQPESSVSCALESGPEDVRHLSLRLANSVSGSHDTQREPSTTRKADPSMRSNSLPALTSLSTFKPASRRSAQPSSGAGPRSG